MRSQTRPQSATTRTRQTDTSHGWSGPSGGRPGSAYEPKRAAASRPASAQPRSRQPTAAAAAGAAIPASHTKRIQQLSQQQHQHRLRPQTAPAAAPRRTMSVRRRRKPSIDDRLAAVIRGITRFQALWRGYVARTFVRDSIHRSLTRHSPHRLSRKTTAVEELRSLKRAQRRVLLATPSPPLMQAQDLLLPARQPAPYVSKASGQTDLLARMRSYHSALARRESTDWSTQPRHSWEMTEEPPVAEVNDSPVFYPTDVANAVHQIVHRAPPAWPEVPETDMWNAPWSHVDPTDIQAQLAAYRRHKHAAILPPLDPVFTVPLVPVPQVPAPVVPVSTSTLRSAAKFAAANFIAADTFVEKPWVPPRSRVRRRRLHIFSQASAIPVLRRFVLHVLRRLEADKHHQARRIQALVRGWQVRYVVHKYNRYTAAAHIVQRWVRHTVLPRYHRAATLFQAVYRRYVVRLWFVRWGLPYLAARRIQRAVRRRAAQLRYRNQTAWTK